MYYITNEFKELVRTLGGEWNDRKKRPIVCLMPSIENPKLYWAIPVGKVNHRNQAAMNRIYTYMNKNKKDLRSCYYHLGRTSNKSIFFISDAIPITDKYILEEHLGSDLNPYIIKNKLLIAALQYKLRKILAFESTNPNYFRQHITDIKKYLLNELSKEKSEEETELEQSAATKAESN